MVLRGVLWFSLVFYGFSRGFVGVFYGFSNDFLR